MPEIFFLSNLHKQILCGLIQKLDQNLLKIRHEIRHSLTVLYWIFKYKPDASETLQVSGLLHDCDRYIDSHRVKEKDFSDYEVYKKKHAEVCATIAAEILTKLDRKDLVKKSTTLIKKHEVGDTPESLMLMDCDSLAYFDKNILEYFAERGSEKTAKKIKFMFERMSDKAKKMLNETDMEFKFVPQIKQLFDEVRKSSQ